MTPNEIQLLLAASPEAISDLAGYEWTETLPIEDRARFQNECRIQFSHALEKDDWSAFRRMCERWRDSAWVMADPDLHARLMEDWDPEGEIEIVRPGV